MRSEGILKTWFSTPSYHRNSRLSEAPSVGKPAILYDAESKGAVNYLNLAKEILQKNNMTKIKEAERTLNPDNEQ